MNKPTAKRAGKIVDPGTLQLDPRLLDFPLAAPWRRAVGMTVDLLLIGLLSLLANAVLGFLTGATLAALGSRNVSDARFWRYFRWVLITIGAGVMLLSGFFLIGHPIVRTSAFNLGAIDSAHTVEDVIVPANPSNNDLRRAVNQLAKQVDTLKQDNTHLRESARGNSVLNLAADFSRTLGLTFGWAGVYFTLLTTWLGGRTLGKMAVGTRVVRLDGRKITAMDAFTRNGGYAAGVATGLIGFLRLLWDPNNQAIQDKIAGTVVVMRVDARDTPSPENLESKSEKVMEAAQTTEPKPENTNPPVA